jgi:hypothetical protein
VWSVGSAQTLINQYVNDPSTWIDGGGPGGTLADGIFHADAQGGGSTNIATTHSSILGAHYVSEALVDGNFTGVLGGKNGGFLQPSGFYGHTTDPVRYMWVSAPNTGAKDFTNRQYVSFSFTDGPDQVDTMRVWNMNETTSRGIRDMWIWYSMDATLPAITGGPGASNPGPGWTMFNGPGEDGRVTLAEAPGRIPAEDAGEYDGETVTLGFQANHVLFMIDSNQGLDDGGFEAFVALSEVQFFTQLTSDSIQIPGDCNQDGALDLSDVIHVLGFLFQGDPASLPCSTALANLALMDCNGDGGIDISDAIYKLAYLFQGGPPPPRGTNCIVILDCPTNQGCR